MLPCPLFVPAAHEQANESPGDDNQDDPAAELGEREAPAEEDPQTMPSSKTRFVEANWKASAVCRLAPFWKSDFAIATAA
jgi:hypothetical protein